MKEEANREQNEQEKQMGDDGKERKETERQEEKLEGPKDLDEVEVTVSSCPGRGRKRERSGPPQDSFTKVSKYKKKIYGM